MENHEEELGGNLLASVSRSFYLTLKALPREVREPVSLAYLLARTADTIADTASVAAVVRLNCLHQFDGLVQAADRDLAAEKPLAELLAQQFCPLQSDEAEATLMRRFGDALGWLHTMDAVSLTAIRSVLATIIEGQRLDIERFPGDMLRSLQTAAELDDYTYRVAGCVGEFWTKLCLAKLDDAFAAGTNEIQVVEWGSQMGKGLQLVNILRDIGKDARLGRCYLPQAEWEAKGLSLVQIGGNPASLRPVWREWLPKCEVYLEGGLRYVQAVNHGTLRYATALPLLLAARTLAHLKGADDSALVKGVKISRFEVTKLLAQTAMNNSPEKLASLYRKLATA